MAEIWKPIEGFEDFYEVSDLGRVRSVDRHETIPTPRKPSMPMRRLKRGRILKPWPTRGGYLVASLRAPGKKKPARVAGLVCRAFHGEPPSPKHEVAHNDGVRTNNAAANLRWSTKSENNLDKSVHGTATGGKRGSRTLSADQIVEARRLRGLGASINAIARHFGCDWSTAKLALR